MWGVLGAQAVEAMLGSTDGNVLERIAKIMSYMRPALVGKSGKRLKRKEKLRMLADGGEAPLNGHLHGSLKPPPQQSTPVKGCGSTPCSKSLRCRLQAVSGPVRPCCVCQTAGVCP